MKQKIIRYIPYIITIMVICVYAWAAAYTVYMTDDFSVASLQNSSDNNWIVKAFNATISFWHGWNGHTFSYIVSILLSPLKWGGIIWLRIFSVMNIFSLCGAVYFFANNVLKYLKIESKYAILIFALIIIPFLSLKAYPEIFYWYTASCGYLVPTLLGFWGLALLVKGKIYNKRIYYIFSTVLMVCTEGGSVQIAGVFAWLFLLIYTYDFMCHKKINKKMSVELVFVMSAALLNALAPGNWVRHSVLDSTGVHWIDSLIGAIGIGGREILFMLKQTPLIVFMILALVLGFKINKKVGKSLFWVIGLWALPFIAVFPVCAGYSFTIQADIPNRTYFILDMAIMLASISTALMLGGYIRQRYPAVEEQSLKVNVGILLAAIICCTHWNIPECALVVTAKALLNGKIQNYSKEICAIYKSVEESEQMDVYVQPLPEPVNGFLTVFLGDVDDGTNRSIAKYYGKNSVQMKADDGNLER